MKRKKNITKNDVVKTAVTLAIGYVISKII